MARSNDNKRSLVAMVLVAAFALSYAGAAFAGTYYLNTRCSLPPSISSGTKPNVMVVLDYSGSMQFPAYEGYQQFNYVKKRDTETYQYVNLMMPMGRYEPAVTYYGLFDPNKYYAYDGSLPSKEHFYESYATTNIVSSADGGDGTIIFTCESSHGLLAGDVAVLTGLDKHTALNGGAYKVLSGSTGTTFKVTAPWNPPGASDDTGQVRMRTTAAIAASTGGQSAGSPITFTTAEPHLLSNGDVVVLTALNSNKTLNGQAFVVSAAVGDQFTITPADNPATANYAWNGASDTQGFFERRSIGNFSTVISGNVLNYYATCRMDAAQKALIGGRADCPGDGNCYLKGQGARRVQPESTNLQAEFFVDLGKSLGSSASALPVYNDSNLWTGIYWNKGDYWDKTTFITVRDWQHSSTITTGDNPSQSYSGWYYERWVLNHSEGGFLSLGMKPMWSDPYCGIRVFVRNANGTMGSEITPSSVYSGTIDTNTAPRAYGQALWEKDTLASGQYYVLAYGGDNNNRRGAYFLYANRPLTKTTDPNHNGVSYASKLGNRTNKKRMQVRLKVPSDQRQGTLQKNFNNVRVGLMTFHSSTSGGCDGDCGQIVVGCENTDVNKLVKAVQADEAPGTGDESTYERRVPIGGTPTGGTLYEALRYFKQSTSKLGGDANLVPSSANSGFIGRGGTHDPYYDYVLDDTGSGQYVFRPCRKSFALVVTDGVPDMTGYGRDDRPAKNPTDTLDPARAAKDFHTTALRTNADGSEYNKVPNAELFAIFTFGGDGGYERRGQSCLRSMAMFGSFKEGGSPTGCTSTTGWPYPFSSWDFDSKFLRWPGLPQQDPDGQSQYPVDPRPENQCPVNSPTTYKECCKEWDRIWDRFNVGGDPDQGTPDNYFEASDGTRLERSLSAALQTMAGALGGAGGAIATVYRDKQAPEGGQQQTVDYLGDLVLRGVYDANDTTTGLLERRYLWRGHLEVFWPFRAGTAETEDIVSSVKTFEDGSSITFTCAQAPNLLVGDTVTFTGLDQHTDLNGQTRTVTGVYGSTFTVEAPWDPPALADTTGQVSWVSAKYDFDLQEAFDTNTQQVKLCNDIVLDESTYGRVRHCWDAAKVLSNRVINTSDARTIYVPRYEWDTTLMRPVLDLDANGKMQLTTLGNTADTACGNDCWNFLIRGTADSGSASQDKLNKLMTWLQGYDNSNTTKFYRDRRDSAQKGWPLGDIVFSTPVVIGTPSPDAVSPNDPDRTSYDTFYGAELAAKRDQVMYVGANDGMVHAFRLGKYCAAKGVYANNIDDWTGDPVCTSTPAVAEKDFGRELWAFMPSTVMNQVQCLADLTYGTESGCKHRAMVDLSPKAHQVLIDGVWKTVIVGGMRGGGDEYFALDVTDPNNPKLLWEYSVLKDLLTYDGSQYSKLASATEHYDDLKLLPVTWSRPALGRLNLGDDIALPTEDPNTSGQPMTASPALTGNRHVIFVGGGFRIFDRTFDFIDGSDPDGDLPTVLQRPFLLALDVATGKNLFKYVWPSVQYYVQANYPDVYFRYLTRNNDIYGVPYAMSDPILLDYLQKKTDGSIAADTDGYVDHLFIGDLNGLLYGFKFNLLGVNGIQGVRVDLRLTKGVDDSSTYQAPYRSMYRSLGQPILVQPQAKKEDITPGYMRVIFGTGKYDDVLVGSDDKTDPPKMSIYNMRDVIGGTTIATDGTPTYNPVKLDDSGAVGQVIGDSGFGVYVKNMCGSTTDSSGTRERSYNSGCTWLKLDTNGDPMVDGNGNLMADCGEDDCTNPCWKCVYDFRLPVSPVTGDESTNPSGDPPGVPPGVCDTPAKCSVKPGERVNTDALIYRDWVFVTSYVPPATPCDYKGNGYLYAFSWMCNNVINPFTDHNPPYELVGPMAYRMELGEGMPSNPVLDTQGRFVFIQMSDRRIVKIGITGAENPTAPDTGTPGTDPYKIKIMGWSEREK